MTQPISFSAAVTILFIFCIYANDLYADVDIYAIIVHFEGKEQELLRTTQECTLYMHVRNL